jgi:hypothetical protein
MTSAAFAWCLINLFIEVPAEKETTTKRKREGIAARMYHLLYESRRVFKLKPRMFLISFCKSE